jgi:hypothetical protein
MIEDGLSIPHSQLLNGRNQRIIVSINLLQISLELLGVLIFHLLHAIPLRVELCLQIVDFIDHITTIILPLRLFLNLFNFEALLDQLNCAF